MSLKAGKILSDSKKLKLGDHSSVFSGGQTFLLGSLLPILVIYNFIMYFFINCINVLASSCKFAIVHMGSL